MRIVFMGNPDFAIPSFQRLHESSHQLIAAVTSPAKPAGRGRRMESPPVQQAAEELGYPVLQPIRLRDPEFLGYLDDMAADIFVVVAFRILPDPILEIPPRGVVNLHPSLLPRYRGAAPIQHSLLAGETQTGVTTILVTPQVDSGDILLQREYPIEPGDDYGSLSDRLASLGAELLVETLDGLEDDRITPRAQGSEPRGELRSAPKIKPEDLVIRWQESAQAIANRIRAFSPKPGAYTYLDGKRLKLFKPVVEAGSGDPGRVLDCDQDLVRIGTADGILGAEEVQIEGRKRMTVGEFCRGYSLETGKFLGE